MPAAPPPTMTTFFFGLPLEEDMVGIVGMGVDLTAGREEN